MKLMMLAEARMVHSQRWAAAMLGRGWQVTMLSVQPRSICGVEVLRLEVPPFGWAHRRRWRGRYAQCLRSTIQRVAPDVVHVHYLHDYPPEGLAPSQDRGWPRTEVRRPPLVISTWGADIIQDQTVPRDTEVQRRRKVTLLQRADAVTATTHYLADCTADYGDIPRERITVIPFGVNLAQYASAPNRQRSGGPVVGFIKHLVHKYGVEYLIRAIPGVLEPFPSTRFVIIGEGPQERALKRLADQLGVTRHIDWRGVIENADVPAALAEMDALVMPSISRSETFGVVAVEAQAAGVPVVFSDLPGVREAVTDEVGGLAVPPRDVNALVGAVCRLLGDEPLRHRLGDNGRRVARERFDFEVNVDQMEAVYRDVLAHRVGRRGSNGRPPGRHRRATVAHAGSKREERSVALLAEASNAHTQRWAAALADRGWRTTVLSVNEAPIEGVEVIPIRVPGFGYDYPHRWKERHARYLRNLIREARADLVHIHFLRDYPLVPAVADDVPLVVSTWGSDVVPFETDPPDSPEQHDCKIALLRGAAAVTATTSYLADRTAEFAGLAREGITVIPFGVDWLRIAEAGVKQAKGPPVIGFVKHLESRYGIQYLIEAIPAVLQRFPAARFVIVGDGPMGDSLVERAEQLGVGGAISWRGRIPNDRVPAALAEMDVFVMPSLTEAFGVSAVEAQATGLPVVFSDLPGAREAVIDGVGGLAVPPADPAALADALCRLLADEPLRCRLGQAGQQMVRQRFDFQDNVDQMEAVYRRVISRRPVAAISSA